MSIEMMREKILDYSGPEDDPALYAGLEGRSQPQSLKVATAIQFKRNTPQSMFYKDAAFRKVP